MQPEIRSQPNVYNFVGFFLVLDDYFPRFSFSIHEANLAVVTSLSDHFALRWRSSSFSKGGVHSSSMESVHPCLCFPVLLRLFLGEEDTWNCGEFLRVSLWARLGGSSRGVCFFGVGDASFFFFNCKFFVLMVFFG